MISRRGLFGSLLALPLLFARQAITHRVAKDINWPDIFTAETRAAIVQAQNELMAREPPGDRRSSYGYRHGIGVWWSERNRGEWAPYAYQIGPEHYLNPKPFTEA